MYKWMINVTIKCTDHANKLAEVLSTSHPDATITFSNDNHDATISLKNDEIPTKDFVLIYRDDFMYKPKYKIVEHSTDKDTIVASINFFPDFNGLSLPQAK